VSVSNHRVTVTPNYSGEELVLFGSVEKDAATPATRTSYDLVVTVSGPRADMVTRRKERKFGIWINTDYRQFLKVPTYLALFSNRPFDTIASPEVERGNSWSQQRTAHPSASDPTMPTSCPNDAFPQRLRAAALPTWPLSRGDFRGDIFDADAVFALAFHSRPRCRSGPMTSRSSCFPMAYW